MGEESEYEERTEFFVVQVPEMTRVPVGDASLPPHVAKSASAIIAAQTVAVAASAKEWENQIFPSQYAAVFISFFVLCL